MTIFFRDPQSQATLLEGVLNIHREGYLKFFELDFVKIGLAAFLTALVFCFDVSYDSNSTCAVLLTSRRTFYVPKRSSKCYEKFFTDLQSQATVLEGGLNIHKGGHLKFVDLGFVKNGLAAFLTAPSFLCVL